MRRLVSGLKGIIASPGNGLRGSGFTGDRSSASLGFALALRAVFSIHVWMPNMPASDLFVRVGDPAEHRLTETPAGKLDAVRQAVSREAGRQANGRRAREIHRHGEDSAFR